MTIILNNLFCSFDTTLVVNDVSLKVDDGEFFVLLGGSGSGKSTLLRMIAGLIQPDSGSISLGGREVTHLPPQERDTGFVFQNYSIFRHLTAAENVEFGLKIRKIPAHARKQRSDELLDLVGLAGLGDRYPSQLSGGQQQRVALARALAYNPAVLLLDEPFGALDVKIRAQLRESVKHIQDQLKVITILVTHDQEEAFYLADRIAVIDSGHIVEIGKPEELYHRPNSEFVAGFIGGGNLLVGRVREGKIALGSVTLDFPPDAPPHDEGAPVRVLFRPESVIYQSEPFEDDSGIVPLGKGRVVTQTFLGPMRRLRFELEAFQGVRSLAPPLEYGRMYASIDVTEASTPFEFSIESHEQWLGLRSFHVLSPGGMKILIIPGTEEEEPAALTVGARIALAGRGPVHLLAVSNESDDSSVIQGSIERMKGVLGNVYGVTAQSRVRSGDQLYETIRHVQEGCFELVVMSRPPLEATFREGYWSYVRRLLNRTHVPFLLIDEEREKFRKILICTAAGEPGKADIRFGGRIARFCNAEATVFHAQKKGLSDIELKRLERYMLQAYHYLQVLGVETNIRVVQEPAVESLVQTIDTGDYDLVVLGAPPPGRSQVHGFHTYLASRTRIPLLIVPPEMI